MGGRNVKISTLFRERCERRMGPLRHSWSLTIWLAVTACFSFDCEGRAGRSLFDMVGKR